MPALIGEGAIHHQARFGMDAWFWSRGLKNGQEQILGLRVGYRASRFTLFAADAKFWVYKNCFHAGIPFSKPYKREN
jgi:hypothetical protein